MTPGWGDCDNFYRYPPLQKEEEEEEEEWDEEEEEEEDEELEGKARMAQERKYAILNERKEGNMDKKYI